MNDLNFKADLHCHSDYSDGSFSPKELILEAEKNSLQGLAITDHDSFYSFEEAYAAAQSLSIRFISGIELSVEEFGEHFHILGYAFDVQNPKFKEFISEYIRNRRSRIQEILKLLQKKDIEITEADLETLFKHPLNVMSLGRPHIAVILTQKGIVNSFQQAFDLFLKKHQICYVPSRGVKCSEAIKMIHQAGGKAILAHPHLIRSKTLIKNILCLPFDGIEGYYCYMPMKDNQRWIDIAEKKKWLVTGGSDFHGSIRPGVSLGQSWTNKETFEILEECFRQNNPHLSLTA